MIMNMIKGAGVVMSSLAIAAVLGGGIWIAKAAEPTATPQAARVTAPAAAPRAAQPANYARLSPFEATRWIPQVRVNGTWYELISIDDQPIAEIEDFVRRNYGEGEIEKRIDEDLVEVLTRKGYPPEASVKLRLRTMDTGKVITLENVPMTEANRQAILRAHNAR